jgi:tetratricopeptide (TPR) repeat protein
MNALSQIGNYKEILKKDPNNLQALINIGNLYFDTRQDLLAIEHYRKALDLDPRNVNVRTDMAVCVRRTGNPDRAVEELKKAISMIFGTRSPGTTWDHPHPRQNDVEGDPGLEALLENVRTIPTGLPKSEIARMGRQNRKAEIQMKPIYFDSSDREEEKYNSFPLFSTSSAFW